MTDYKPLVIGLGNEFRGDDAFGIMVIRKLKEKHPGLADFVIDQGDLIRILDHWINRKVIVIDTLFTKDPVPGKVHHFRSLDEVIFINKKQYSSHGFGLSDIYELGISLNKKPKSVYLIGVEGTNWQVGSKMSITLSMALSQVIRMVLNELEN